ncbi:hypothetical protein [Pyxidicoccus sp. MSG2]|uniref:hypothetical protein n=1 Tax=Pyxidicoccus sp. MSG2 TaxID=2996790 RepID=UPI00226D86F4|nr:hypothetical protein [Pyxidicoccus sp. MSG2]MCY1022906.1 hypothetical protein [Pyxidicoccus sp. MSG2]
MTPITVQRPTPERVSQHLRERLEKSAIRSLTPHEESLLKSEGPQAFVLKQLLSKNFRKWSVNPDTQKNIARAVDIAVRDQKPLRLVHPMGGYKIWRLPSAPEVDWAEFFSMAHMLHYLSGIAAAYAPGVHLQYFMYTLLPQRHDNLPADDVQRYVDSFQVLLDAFGKHLPPNVKLSIVREDDFYSREEYFSLLDERYEMIAPGFNDFPESQRKILLTCSRQNIKWMGAEDWTRLAEAEKDEKVLRGAVYEMVGNFTMDRTAEFLVGEDKIMVFVSRGPSNIGIGSTKSSRAKFWIGTGVLEDRGGELYDTVLTPGQVERIAEAPRSLIEPGLLPLRNLGSVQVIHQHLDFSQPSGPLLGTG